MRMPALHFLADRIGGARRGQLASHCQLTLHGPAQSRHVRGGSARVIKSSAQQ